MIKVFIGVVIYGTAPEKTETLSSVFGLDLEEAGLEPFFYIRDNSINGFDTGFIGSSTNNYVCIHTGENEKLSSVYNQMVDYSISECINPEIYIFLDDDSRLDINYFKAVVKFINSNSGVAIPYIINNEKLISPGYVEGVKGHSLNYTALNTGDNFNNNIVAMMSGVVIKRAILELKEITFCEELLFYGVDTRFFLDYAKTNTSIYLLDYKLKHDSALRNENYEYNDMYKRLSDIMNAHFFIFSNQSFFRLRLFFYFPRFILEKIVNFRDLRFLSLFKNYKLFWRNR